VSKPERVFVDLYIFLGTMAVLLKSLVLLLPFLAASIRVNDGSVSDLLDPEQEQAQPPAEAPAEPDEEPTMEQDQVTTADDECGSAIENGVKRNSGWRRWSAKCKCQRNTAMVCPGQDCEKLGRYYSAKRYQGAGCRCDFCPKDCSSIVTGSQWRNSAWRRKEAKCKCGADQEIRGKTLADDENCVTKRKDGRYFIKSEMRGVGCQCVVKGTAITDPPTTAVPNTTLAPAPNGTNDSNITEPTRQPNERPNPGAATRSSSLLAAGVAMASALAVAFV